MRTRRSWLPNPAQCSQPAVEQEEADYLPNWSEMLSWRPRELWPWRASRCMMQPEHMQTVPLVSFIPHRQRTTIGMFRRDDENWPVEVVSARV